MVVTITVAMGDYDLGRSAFTSEMSLAEDWEVLLWTADGPP
jgi:hypothetical protein